MLQKQLEKISLIGCGGHARCVADIIMQSNPHIQLTFLDKNAKEKETIMGFPCLKLPPQNIHGLYTIAVGDNKKRQLVHHIFDQENLVSIISSFAYASKTATIQKGCFIGNFCNIGAEVAIGHNTIINTGAVIEHGTSIGNHCHIAPQAAIAGNVKIGNLVFIGIGASVIDGIQICSNVTIGAGATVVKNITQPGTYVGTPAKKIKSYGEESEKTHSIAW